MPKASGIYQLFYWPEIQGRGEFVRLTLEDGGARYVDVARGSDGTRKLLSQVEARTGKARPFAPPLLRWPDGSVVAQTAAILHRLAPELKLAPKDERGRARALELQLTVADLVAEAHDTHHPMGNHLYYEDQKPEAARRARSFVVQRIPKFLGYFEAALADASTRREPALLGRHSYVDLSLFQALVGLQYAFPNALDRLAPRIPRLLALCERVRTRPRIAAYLQSPRRIAFNEQGIFRHYPELDLKPVPKSRAVVRKRAKG